MVDKVLQRIELENKKKMLETVKQQATKHELYIETPRGIYKLPLPVLVEIWGDIRREIEDINNQLEELTGLNQNKIESLYEV